MRKYIIKRLLQLIPVLIGITFLSFAMMRLAGGDAVTYMYENAGSAVSQEVIDNAKAEYGLDKPFLVQYATWFAGMVTGDMGESYVSHRDVYETFISKLPATMMLTGCQKEEVEKLVAPLVADVQETPEATEVEEEKSPLIPEIDDTLSIEEGARIAVVSKSKKGEFWNKVKEGMEAAVKDVNEAYGFKKDKQITMTFEGPDDEEDVESQINTLDAVIAENPSVVCLSAGDMDSCQAQLEAAKENGIPVVAFDSNVSDTKLVRAFRGTDNTQIGKYAAYKLGSAIGKMGNVAVFSAQEKTQSAQERVKGFLDNIANYTDIKVVETVYSDQVDDMKEAMKEVLDKYPALDGVFCTNAEVSEMFLEVNKDTGENKVAMVGVDATSKQQEAIQKGEELGVLSQNPYAMGYQTMWAAIQSTAPKKETKIDKKVLLDPVWIDAENIKSEDITNYLYN